jgi:hypothetical protein
MAGRYGVSLELHDQNYRINYRDAINYRLNLTLREFINVLATHIEEAWKNEYERYQLRGTEDSLGNKYYVGVDGGNLKIKGRDGRIKTFGIRLNEGETILDGPLELLKYSVNMDGFAYDKITKRVYFVTVIRIQSYRLPKYLGTLLQRELYQHEDQH